MKNNLLIGLSILLLFIIITIFSSITTVPTGYVGVKTHFGQVMETTIQEGLNFKTPYIEKIVLIDCRTKQFTIESSSASKDLQDVGLSVTVNYSVNKDKANTLYQETGIDYEDILVQPAILESIKSATAQYTAEQLITSRQEVSNAMQTALKEKLETKGFNIIDLSITNLEFSEAYNQAIEEKQVAQQKAQKAEYELEQAKIQNQIKVENAKAESEVMALQNKQITNETLRLKALEVQEQLINKWNGTLPSTMLSEGISSILNIQN